VESNHHRRYTLAALVAVVLVAAAAGCGGGSDESSEPAGGTTATPTQTITIDESEYKLDPATVNLDKAGTYEFEAVNNGTIDHALEIEGGDLEEETDTIAPGQSATLTVTLADDTTYELYCPIGSHADQGMKGSIVVGTGGSSSSSDDDESSGGY
jgi:plastocyanin